MVVACTDAFEISHSNGLFFWRIVIWFLITSHHLIVLLVYKSSGRLVLGFNSRQRLRNRWGLWLSCFVVDHFTGSFLSNWVVWEVSGSCMVEASEVNLLYLQVLLFLFKDVFALHRRNHWVLSLLNHSVHQTICPNIKQFSLLSTENGFGLVVCFGRFDRLLDEARFLGLRCWLEDVMQYLLLPEGHFVRVDNWDQLNSLTLAQVRSSVEFRRPVVSCFHF